MSGETSLITVLVTGGSGFLGQHIIKHLHQCSKVNEIRNLDIRNFQKNLEYDEVKAVKSVYSDINNLSEEGRELFRGVDCVFHCAALVSYQFPPDEKALYTANVEGTKNVIKQCIRNNVPNLVFTSGTEVCQKPYFKNGYFSLIIYQSESKVGTPTDPSELVFGTYGKTKLQAETIVLNANNSMLRNGVGKLKTVSLRPTLLYGEGDNYLIPNLHWASRQGDGIIWGLFGSGGKHQLTYAGNAAWGHICAMEALIKGDNYVDGVAMFITDDTPIYDISRTTKTLFYSKDINSNNSFDSHKLMKSPRKPFYVPSFIAFLLIWIFNVIYSNTIAKISKSYRLWICPKLCVVYSSSTLFFSRLKANLRINYKPLYPARDALENSSKYYRSHFFHK